MAESWQDIAARKQEANRAKIPQEWRLKPEVLSQYSMKSDVGVLDVPRTCGILTEKEIQLTEQVDATALLEQLATGKVRCATSSFCIIYFQG